MRVLFIMVSFEVGKREKEQSKMEIMSEKNSRYLVKKYKQ